MADLFYYESGYIDEKYFAYVADAEAYISPYFEDGYLELGYFLDQGGVSSLTCDAQLAVIIVNASGSFSSSASVSAIVGNIKPLAASANSQFSQSTDNLRLRPLDAGLSSEFAQTVSAGRIQQAAASVTANFTPSLVADAFKNHTAILDSVSTMSVDAVVGRSGNVLLEHIANLNAMAAKSAVYSATMASTSSLNSTSTKTTSASITAVSSSAVTAIVGKFKTVSADLSCFTELLASRYTGYWRPRVLWSGGNFVEAGTEYGSGQTAKAKYGSYAISNSTDLTGVGRNTNGQAVSNPDWYIAANEEFAIEFHIYRAPNTDIYISGGQSQPMIYMANAASSVYWNDTNISTAYYNMSWALGIVYNNTGANSGKTQWRFRFNNGTGYTDINSTTVSGFNTLTDLINQDTWYHIAVNRTSDGVIRMFSNGTQIGSAAYSGAIYQNSLNRIRFNTTTIVAEGGANPFTYRSYIDEFVYKVGSSAITTGSSAGTNSDYVSTQRILLHFENTAQDDLTVNHSLSQSLTSTAQISAQANGNTKSATASLSMTASQTATILRIKSLSADLQSLTTVLTNGGKLKGITDTLASEFNLQDGLARIRYGESTQNSLFSPSVNVVATKSGEILLQPEFTITVNANSFTEVPAALASQFAITAGVDGVTRSASASLSSTFNIQQNAGKRQTATAAISSAFNAVVNVKYFEGTSLLTTAAATMSVTAVKTARITKTLAATSSVTANGRENAQAPAANGFYANPYPERVVIDMVYNYVYDRQAYTTLTSASPNRINKAFWIIAYLEGDSAAPGNYPQWDTVTNAPLTAQAIFADTTGGTNSATATIEFTVYEKDFSGTADYNYFKKKYSVNAGVVETITNAGSGLTNGSGTIQIILDKDTPNYITVYANGSTTPQTISSVVVTSPASSSFVDTMLNRPYRVNNPPPVVFGNFRGDIYSYPDGQPTRDLNLLSISSQSISEQQETIFYGPQEYAIADLVDFDFASLSASAITVVFLQTGLVAGSFTQNTVGYRIRFGQSTAAVQTNIFANGGKQATGSAAISAQASISISGLRVRSAQSSINSQATITCVPTRQRPGSAALTAQAQISITAVKRTGNIVTAQSTVTQTTQGERIRYAGSTLSAFYTQLSVAAKNAKGTILCESQFTQTTQAEKNAIGVITINSQFDFTPNTAQGKIVGASATLASEFTEITNGDRIQPAGSDMTAAFAQNCLTLQSKITGISAALNSQTALTAAVKRFRESLVLEAGSFAVVCDNQVLRLAQASLSINSSILCSPTFIVRITAEFTAFNTQLTIGEVINIDPYLTLWIKPESRLIEIQSETRIITILQETRVNIIEGYTQ